MSLKCEVCNSTRDVIEFCLGRTLVYEVCEPCRASGAFVEWLAEEFEAAVRDDPQWRENPDGTWTHLTQ